MLPSERIELGIYRYVRLRGRSAQTSITSLEVEIGGCDSGLVVERLLDLESKGRIELFKWLAVIRHHISEFRNYGDFFYTDRFDIEITPLGRPYFEKLEATFAEDQLESRGLGYRILEYLDEHSDATVMLPRLKAALSDFSNVPDWEWRAILDAFRIFGFVSFSGPNAPMLITFQGRHKFQSLRQEPAKVSKGELIMGDKYEIYGQAAAVGPGSHVNEAHFVQVWNQTSPSIDLIKLAEQLSALRQALLKEATGPEHFAAIGAVASAEIEAKCEHGPKVLQYLQGAGKWALDVASKVGAEIATAAIKSATGL